MRTKKRYRCVGGAPAAAELIDFMMHLAQELVKGSKGIQMEEEQEVC